MTSPVPSAPAPADKGPIEKKVTWSAVGTYLGSVAAVAVLTTVSGDPGLISGLPDWLEALLLPLIPTAVAFFSGYSAQHTPRPDLADPPAPGPLGR